MSNAETILIRKARAYDPSQGWRGELRDLYVADGRITEPFDNPQRTVDAGERPLLGGGIDPYSQIAGLGHSLTRMFAASPSPDEIGRAYARMGYVHVHHPFTTLLTAGLTRHALGRIPFVDTSTCVAIDPRDMGQSIRAGQIEEFSRLARALLHLTGALGLSLPFPALRHKQRHYLQKNLSEKKVLSFLSMLEDPAVLPIHLWGMPGLLDNEFPEPDRFHIAGLGFALDSETAFERAKGFLEAGGSGDLGLSTGQDQLVVAPQGPMEHPPLSLDMGLQTPLAFLSKPIPLDQERAVAGWALLRDRGASWRLALSASGPAGGQFGGMPSIIAWLINPGSSPPELCRTANWIKFDLSEWARLTRLEPARCLGLLDMGHLRVGARANIALYDLRDGTDGEDVLSALTDCWCLLKDGVFVRERGAFTGHKPSVEIRCREIEEDLSGLEETNLFQNPTLRFENLSTFQGERDRPEGH